MADDQAEEVELWDEIVKTRKWLRQEVSKQITKDLLYGALADLELAANPFFLGMDYSDDLSGIDDIGPF